MYLDERGKDITVADLMIDALVRLDISSFDELVKLSGKLDAIAAVKPYRRMDMQHVNLDLRNKLNIKSNGPDAMVTTYLFAGLHSVTKENMSGEIKEKGGVGIFKDCLYKDASPEFCLSISHAFTEALADLVNPEYESYWTHHQSSGDPFCRFIFKRRSDPISVLEDLGETVATVPTFDLPKENIQALSIMTGAVFLNENTRGFVDLHGSEKTIEVLGAVAERTGKRIGEKLVRGNPQLSKDAESIGKLIHSLEKSLAQRDAFSIVSKDKCMCEVTDCTQQQFVPEQCKQLESLFNGIVHGVNPGFEFAYDRMMTNRDKTCHWTIKKKKERLEEGAADTVLIEDPARMLAMRFAKGEIPHEEFDRSMELLKKHKVVK
jgi:hypothetical protein